jgi:Mrp family chromosome partitioning ATPase
VALNGRSSLAGLLRRRRVAGDPVEAERTRAAYERGLGELLERVAPSSARQPGRGRSVALVSAEPRQGATTAAANLAIFAAQRRRLRTLLIDASEGSPQLHLRFRLPVNPGLAERLRGDATTSASVHATVFGRLDLLPLGYGGLLQGADGIDAFRALLEEARGEYDLTLIDSGDVRSEGASLRLAAVADACVLVVDPARGRRGNVEETAARLRSAGATLAGFIFNQDSGR